MIALFPGRPQLGIFLTQAPFYLSDDSHTYLGMAFVHVHVFFFLQHSIPLLQWRKLLEVTRPPDVLFATYVLLA